MKRILSLSGIIAISFFVLSAFSIRENPQDPPRGKKKIRHIQLVEKDSNGKTVELDTVIHGDQVFVWNGDTIGNEREFKWTMKGDSLDKDFNMNFSYEIEDDADGNIFVIKQGKGGKRMLHEFKMDGDSAHAFVFDIDENEFHGGDDNMFWVRKDSDREMFFHSPRPNRLPRPPRAPELMFLGKQNSENVIDLSDPGIISYKKKLNKDGTEKITIVRKQVDEDAEKKEEIIIHGAGDAMFMPAPHPVHKSVKVIKSDDGKIEVIEEGGVWSVSEDDENVKVIKEDGKVIRIKEIKNDGEKNIDVKVEVETEKENN